MTTTFSSPMVWQCGDDWCVGQLHRYAGTPKAQPETGIVIISGGTQTRVGAHRGLWRLAKGLVRHDRAVLRFDRRGFGDSTGQPGSFETLDDEIICAVRALRSACPAIQNLVLLGHCDGASAALLAAGDLDNEVGLAATHLILMNPWARTEKTAAAAAVRHNYGAKLSELATWKRLFHGQINLKKAIVSIFNGLKAKLTIRSQEPTGFISRMALAWTKSKCRISIIHGTADATAQEFEMVSKTWHREAPLSYYLVTGGDHSFSTSAQQRSALAQIELALNCTEI